MSDTPRVKLALTLEQAATVSAALDLYSRLAAGQIEEIAALVATGVIPAAGHPSQPKAKPSPQAIADVRAYCEVLKSALGHPGNGSLGIAHPHVHIDGRRSYEVKKVLDKAVTDAVYPDRRWTVHGDGLLSRLTADAMPEAEVIGAAPVQDPVLEQDGPSF